MRHWVYLGILVGFAAALACSSSDDTPLGSEFVGNILGSKPGVVFEDTIGFEPGDTTYSFYPLIDGTSVLEVGREQGYVRTAVLRADFSNPGGDTLRTVASASLRLNFDAVTPTGLQIPVRFYRLGTMFSEGDSIADLDTLSAIVDPSTGSVDRTMEVFPVAYELPPELVEGWIKGDSLHNGIAIVFTDAVNENVVTLESSESTANPPVIQVTFTDGGSVTNYKIVDDGTMYRPETATSNLVVSDGFVRRIHFRVDLTQVNDSAAVHEARVRLNIVPGSVFGADQTLVMYIPDSEDPSASGFRTGQLITQEIVDDDLGYVQFSVTVGLLLVLSGDEKDTGFAIRFDNEPSILRQVEFYGSDDPVNHPTVEIVYSTPAAFEK